MPSSFKKEYAVIRPGGNDTALVFGIERDAGRRQEINAAIMNAHPNVEQVGFVELDPAALELLMAGNEFCGNATRSAAWLALAGAEGTIQIQVSGVSEPLDAGVDAEGNAWAQMPIYPESSRIEMIDDETVLVNMEGISHIVVDDLYPDATPEELKKIAFNILQKMGLDTSLPAAGVMFLTRTADSIKMRPVVWVRDIKTLFYETACGSGTTAVGLLEAIKQGNSVKLPVIQPSEMPINISVEYTDGSFKRAVISGPVEVIIQSAEVTI